MSNDLNKTDLKAERIKLNDNRILNYRIVLGIASDVEVLIEHESPQCDLFHESVIINGVDTQIVDLIKNNPDFIYLDELQAYLSKYGFFIVPPL